MKRTRHAGFTLIELLVVLAIISLIAALLFPALSQCLSKARMVREQSCARSLVIGVFNYAQDHNDEIIPGYHNQPTTGPDGEPLSFPASARYPWRLMPYIGGSDSRIMWANPDGRTEKVSRSSSEAYAVSITPSLGMNIFYVGGDDSGMSGQGIKPTEKNYELFGKFCVTRMTEVQQPSRLIIFASARMPGDKGKIVPGYFMIQAPAVAGSLWSAQPFSDTTAPAQHGYVDFRYGGKAVAAHLDGHVEMLNEEEMRDMRRWSNLAAIADDPDARLTR